MTRYETIHHEIGQFLSSISPDDIARHAVIYDGDIICSISGSRSSGFRYHCPPVDQRKYNVAYYHVKSIIDEEAAKYGVDAKLVMTETIYAMKSYPFSDCIILSEKKQKDDDRANTFWTLPLYAEQK